MGGQTMSIQYTQHTTSSGLSVWFNTPSATPVSPRDLRVHLGTTRRYGGAADCTVLQHLALCAALAHDLDPLTRAYVAAHDMHEAYVLDIPIGLKDHLPDYQAIEALWEAHVHEFIGLDWPPTEEIRAAVKVIDVRSLVAEMEHLGHPLTSVAEDNHGGPATPEERALAARWLGRRSQSELWRFVWGAVQEGKP